MFSLRQVQKKYDHFCLDCSLEVKSGTVVGLIGQNGAGKSTTFKAILDLIKIDRGNIRVFAKQVGELSAAEKEMIGVVLSDSGFSSYLKIKDIQSVLRCFYSNFDDAMFTGLVQDFGLPVNKPLKDFSSGMKAKLKVIAAITHRARLLILDEPTAGLDVIARDEVLDLLRHYLAENENSSILISSHISGDLENLCDEIYIMDQGKIILHEDINTLLNDYAVIKTTAENLTTLDKRFIVAKLKTGYGSDLLVRQRDYYRENYPNFSLKKAGIDSVTSILIKGERL